VIDPGQMRTKLVYQEPPASPTLDSYGQPVEEWADVATVWARLRPLSGRELYYAQQMHAQTTHEVVTRWRPGIKPTGRFTVADGSDPVRVLNILGIADFESRRIELTISCVEPTPSGDASP
jgi:SPP1 family predicted phage head-tail adaptor